MLRIKDWDCTFENATTRKIVQLRYFCCPVDLQSTGYLTLMAQGQKGVAAYGVFIALCQYSGSLNKERRGTIARKNGDAVPLSVLSAAIGIDETVLNESLELLCSPEVAWISQQSPTLPECDTQQSPTLPESHSDNLPLEGRGGEVMGGEVMGGECLIPDRLNTPEVRDAFRTWCGYLERKSPDKVPSHFDDELVFWKAQLPRGPDGFVCAVQHTIANGWLNLRDPDNGKATSNGQSLTYEEVFGLDKQ
jgi:hypothetical protein